MNFYALVMNRDTTIRELAEAAGPHDLHITLKARRDPGMKKKKPKG